MNPSPFFFLTGEQGGTLRAAIAQQGQFGKVTRAIHKIHSCYHEHLDVEALAQEAQIKKIDPSPLLLIRTNSPSKPRSWN